MGNCQGRVGPGTPRPEQDIEIERPRAPALAGAAAEARIDFLHAREHFGRAQRRGDERDRIGIAPAGGRSGERRVGKEGVSPCSSRWTPSRSKKTYYI